MKKSLSLARRIVPCLFCLLSVGLSAEPASARSKPPAATAKRRIAVGGFSGPKSADARNAVLDALKAEDDYDVSDAAELPADADDQSCAKVARSMRAQAVLTGTVKKGSTLVLSVHSGADGALIQDVEIKGDTPAKLGKDIDESLIIDVADVIAQGKPPGKARADDDDGDEKADPKPKAKPKDEDEDEKPSPAKEHKSGPSAFEAVVGIRGTRRSFWYQDTADQLRPSGGFPVPLTYLLPFGPAPFLDVIAYPLAFASHRGAGDDIGLMAGGEFGIPLKVVLDSGGQTELTTSSHQFYAGLRDRIRTGHHAFGVFAAFGQHAYSLKGSITPAPAFKDITYTFVKLGIDAQLVFGAVTLGAHAGPRIVLSPGPIKNVFPHAKALAIDAGLSGGYALSDGLDLTVGFDFLRYGFNFNPVDTDVHEDGTPRIAGGAVDQYLSASAGVRAHF